jgi:hypothetical protein
MPFQVEGLPEVANLSVSSRGARPSDTPGVFPTDVLESAAEHLRLAAWSPLRIFFMTA